LLPCTIVLCIWSRALYRTLYLYIYVPTSIYSYVRLCCISGHACSLYRTSYMYIYVPTYIYSHVHFVLYIWSRALYRNTHTGSRARYRTQRQSKPCPPSPYARKTPRRCSRTCALLGRERTGACIRQR
jgi:hypothetical protein